MILIDTREKPKAITKIENNYIVYSHISPNNKIYIGITKQKPEYRWKNGNGYKHNDYFTKSIKKYGWENFEHRILFENLTLEEAKNKEIELIKFYNSTNRNYGYNITKGGDPCNKGLTEEGKKKNRRISQNKWNEKNKDKLIKISRKYEDNHREERRKRANELNKTEKRKKHRTEYMRKYRELNREKIRKIAIKSYYKNKGEIIYD